MNEKYIQSLRDAVQKTHKCACRYAQSVTVKEEANGQVVWEGKVEVFDLAGHAQARQCYAWGQKDETGRWEYVTSLKVPPVDSAQRAIQGFLANRQKT